MLLVYHYLNVIMAFVLQHATALFVILDIVTAIRNDCVIYGSIEKVVVPKNGRGKCKVTFD